MLPGLLFQPQLASWGALHVGVGLPALTNASVSVYALHPLELEVGVEGSLGYRGLTARVGPGLHVLDRRNEAGRGVTMHAPMLVGYRRMDFGRDHPGHMLTVSPSLTTDVWLARHVALEAQLTVGAAFTVSDPSGGVGLPVIPDGQLRFGLAF